MYGKWVQWTVGIDKCECFKQLDIKNISKASEIIKVCTVFKKINKKKLLTL